MKKDKRAFKMPPSELEEFLEFRKRGSKVEPKRGKGSFKRKPKHKDRSLGFCA